jgi:hypothetical protein
MVSQLLDKALEIDIASNVFMSNKEKGLSATLKKKLLKVLQAYYC